MGTNLQSNHERRLWPRHFTGTGNPVVASIGVVPHCAFIRDLSLTGLSLLTTHALPIGSAVPVSIAGPQPGQTHLLLVAVLRCDPAEDGLHRVAGRFSDEASVAAARDIIAAMPESESLSA